MASKDAENVGNFVAAAIVTAIAWAFMGPWAILFGLAIYLIVCSKIGQLMQADSRRAKNARKMRRELRMDQRSALADEYIARHPDKA